MQLSDACEMAKPRPKSRVPSVTHDCPAALVVAWQYVPPTVTRNLSLSGRRSPVGVGGWHGSAMRVSVAE